ncbi:2-oxoacid:acceptor oxidoreductase subunit alpha [candidate division KSB1 bacterium]|nr:2-oxoacid:acceptor oxidoreductase subunit alpha [candidate division KSB1 bacterium]
MSGETKKQVQVMTGNEACVLGAIAAGVKFYAGYPITPSSEIAEELSVRLPMIGGTFIQMEDEIASMGAIIGASLVGVKSMTATSGPGFSLKQENIGYASMAEIPCVIVNVMRGGPSTGLPTLPSQSDVMQARWGTHGDHPIIALVPFSVRDTFDLTIQAFNLSEKFRTPVVVLLDEIIGHINEKVTLPDPETITIINRERPTASPAGFLPYQITDSMVPPMASFGEGYRFHVTGLCHDETGFPTNDSVKISKLLYRLNRKLEVRRDEIVQVESYSLEDAEIGIFAYGSSARSARRAVALARQQGLRVGLMRPLVIWPFPDREVLRMAEQVSHIIVPEMNLGQIAHEVEWASRFKAEVVPINRIDGEPIRPEDILTKIVEIQQLKRTK